MSWKCEICDSYNPEGSRECFVCGQARSAESIRDEKKKLQEEKLNRIGDALSGRGFFLLRAPFVIILSVSIAVTVVAVIERITGREMGIFLQNLVSIRSYAATKWSYVLENFGFVMADIAESISQSGFVSNTRQVAGRISACNDFFVTAANRLIECIGSAVTILAITAADLFRIIQTHFQ